jgi:hypothetical protein
MYNESWLTNAKALPLLSMMRQMPLQHGRNPEHALLHLQLEF